MSCGNLFGSNNNNYIKVGNGEFVAISGSNIAERLLLSDLRIPYKQILKGKIILKPGQDDYLLNHLGLGDNVTFLAIKPTYDAKSVIEADNYLIWKPFNNATSINYMSQLLVLTGNSDKRIPQLFISNPNDTYSVILDIMLAVIDDEASYFNYKPVVYFTDIVTLEDTEYTAPFNTSLGTNFGATLSISDYSYSLTLSGLLYLLVDEVKDSNGIVLTTTTDNYILYDTSNTQITTITSTGTYSLYFDITDSLGNSVDTVDNIQISII